MHKQLTHVCTPAQSHWKSQGHQRAHFFSDWFNPTHLAFHDPSNHATVMPARVDSAACIPRKALYECGTARLPA